MGLNINRTLIGGNVVSDPVLSEVSKYTKVCEFTIANNRVFYDREGKKKVTSNYIEIVTWNKVAEIAKNLKKSDGVICDGELVENRWTTKHGDQRKKLRVKAYKIYRDSNIREDRENTPPESTEDKKEDTSTVPSTDIEESTPDVDNSEESSSEEGAEDSPLYEISPKDLEELKKSMTSD